MRNCKSTYGTLLCVGLRYCCVDWSLDLQECTSHAINVLSEECSASTIILKRNETVASWSDNLIMRVKPVGKGTFGTVFE